MALVSQSGSVDRNQDERHFWPGVLIALVVWTGGLARSEQADQVQAPITLEATSMSADLRNPRFPPGNPAPTTRKMARRLVEIAASAEPGALAFMSDRMAARLEQEVAAATTVQQKLKLQFQLGAQQTRAGRPDQALNTFASLERRAAEAGIRLDVATRTELRKRKAIAFLRLGEQENCIACCNGDSCLFPLEPRAFHLQPRGSRGAVALLNEQLEASPDDLSSRWLLNLAYMTLGDYPGQVPSNRLIPPKCFASEYEMPRFRNVAPALGLDLPDLAGGVIIDDFDNDGFYDIVTSAWDLEGQLRFFHNNGNGTFTERTSEAGLVGETGALNITQTDYNNDGRLDIWMSRGGWLGKAGRMPQSLLRNNGDGTFTDVTEEAGLLSLHPSQACRWFDFDGDGWLDLFIGNESSDPEDPDPCELYHNNRDGTFTECAKACGINVAAWVKAVACADYDNDGRPDLFLSVREGDNVLLHNDGPDASGHWHFSDATVRAGLGGDRVPSFATFFFDYDNDGWQDLVVFGFSLPHGVGDVAADYLGLTNSGAKTRLYHNNHDGTFSDVSRAAHLNRICHTMAANYGDLDNDGWLDFYCGTGDPDLQTLIPKRMFRNAEGKLFQDVTTATRTGHLQKGHGIAFADLTDRGAQDIYASLGGAYTGDGARNALFLNPGTTNHWLKLRLVGVKANRPAIGARIKVAVKTRDGVREIHRVVSSGGSFGSNPFRQEIGLGDAVAITEIEIRWPGSNTRQIAHGFEIDHSYQLTEGDPKVVSIQLHPVNLDRPMAALAHPGSHSDPP